MKFHKAMAVHTLTYRSEIWTITTIIQEAKIQNAEI
jgi:hypothetical protein